MTQPSPLAAAHAASGARLGDFAGWSMPTRFAGTLVEHEAVRTSVGVFDVSHLGTVWIDGPDASDVVAATFTNDPRPLVDGTSQYTLVCDERGGIVDDVIVTRLSASTWLAVPNAANTLEVVATLRDAAVGRDATVRDESTGWAILAVQGPRALALTGTVFARLGVGVRPEELAHLGVAVVGHAGDDWVVSRTGYTGEPGCELVLPVTAATGLWQQLLDAGAVPCGLESRDILRLEMGYPLHGSDLSVDRDPYEARLSWAVKPERGGFPGAAALAAASRTDPVRRLWGLVAEGRRPLRAGMDVTSRGRPVGVSTSGTYSPTCGRPIALAYLATPLAPGDRVQVDLRGTLVDAEVTRPPFVDRDPRG